MKRLSPNQIIFLSFAGAIALGAVALRLAGGQAGQPVGWVDALFTSTSATCVTGLIVRDTGTEFSRAGQLIILALIQIGGLGIITFSSWFLFMLGRRITLSERSVVADSFGLPAHLTVRRLLGRVIIYTAIIEAAGAALLFARFAFDHPPAYALYAAIFHSIAAFCNAGFSLFRNSFCDYPNDPVINFTIMALIVLGGLGFYVLEEIRACCLARWRGQCRRMSLHTRVVVRTTALLIVVGAVAIYVLQGLNADCAEPWYARILPALFQSVATRTAGFNTMDMGTITNGTALVMILLMFIGASPGSTGGGIKTTTFATLAALFVARWRGRTDAEIGGRRIPADLVGKAMAVSVGYLSGILLCVMVLQISELTGQPPERVRGAFLDLTFETVSAFGTVGLSLGATPYLTPLGKLVITIAMFIGRVGPLAFALTLIGERQGKPYRYPEERILIG
ncbi:MAG: TrkH family potassium uptake protein [Candidatus Sumerlaeia bacterium]|nr:TrkH family potassium uptake protein [Candidatus Sumerlaeia bacterium]